ncbi:hypothetical protein [Salinarimonas ramus]|uniref:UrcA family protein n=1 Tax=Salinarimonas ramus TaxID=690164 RepID=A0A917Q463_9HYPH|nr:hypothetical protein [Salinarimonas ramus]GGK19121.1 hypothetical protein GCM10011322_02220 [Salinarimonas ramus]
MTSASTSRTLPSLVFVALAALALGACTQTSAPEQASGPSARAASLALPGSSACAREIRAFRDLLDRDNETGFVGASVYRDATRDLEGPAATCRAGDDAAARAALRAVKTRYGYPA